MTVRATVDDAFETKIPPHEVAKMLGVSDQTVYRLIESKSLFAYRVGRRLSVPLSAVREFLAENTTFEETH